MLIRLWTTIICLGLMAFATSAAHAEKRIALLIGNASYSDKIGELDNPVKDLTLVRSTLLKAGFLSQDIVVVPNADRRTLLREMDAFIGRASQLTSNDMAFFYYSGHGAKRPGSEALHLIPVDAVNVADTSFWYDTVSFDTDFIGRLEKSGTNAALVISIDACRNELKLPVRAMGSGDKGFGVIPNASGMLISFAADNNQTARDYVENGGVKSPNSPYALALSEELLKPGRAVSTAFGAIRPNVLRRTSRIQQPVFVSKLNRDPVLVAAIGPGPGPSIDPDEADWGRLNGFGKSGLEIYLSLHPNGKYAGEARVRLSRIVPDVKPTPQPKPLPTPTPTPKPNKTFAIGQVFQDALKSGGKGPEMVVVPSGRFMMGSPTSEAGRGKDEGPPRTVTIPKAFAVGKFEVTWDDWDRCVAAGGCDDAGPVSRGGDEGWGKGTRPVINVSWNDAQAYVRWLSSQTGETYRLLSEAEWEYAARAGTTTAYAFGNSISTSQANFNQTVNKTTGVGSYPANSFGLHDMHGNVWEWVEDCYQDSYSGAPSDGSARQSCNTQNRVYRGGSWGIAPSFLRSANRVWSTSVVRFNGLGFRVARVISE